jgi:hypothetical protein
MGSHGSFATRELFGPITCTNSRVLREARPSEHTLGLPKFLHAQAHVEEPSGGFKGEILRALAI